MKALGRVIVLCVVMAQSICIADEASTEAYFTSIRNNPLKLRMFLRDMPKGGDLHNHLSGAVYAETFLGWALTDRSCFDPQSYAVTSCGTTGAIPSDMVQKTPELYRAIVDAWSMRNWQHSAQSGHDHFFDTFGKFGAAGTGHLGGMLRAAMQSCADNKTSYVEYMIGFNSGGIMAVGSAVPYSGNFQAMRDSLLNRGFRDTLKRVVTIINEAEKAIPSELRASVAVRYLQQVYRGLDNNLVFAQILAGFELAELDSRMVGFNLVMPEDYPACLQNFDEQMKMINALRPLYRKAHISLHAGELALGLVPPDELCCHIRKSIEYGHAERIGHGVDVAYEDNAKELLAVMSNRKIMVEICLTSNDGILGVKGSHHPYRLYQEHGVPMALATDDEGVSRSDMTNEFFRAAFEQDATYMELKDMVYNSIAFSFMTHADKAAMKEKLDKQFLQFELKIR